MEKNSRFLVLSIIISLMMAIFAFGIVAEGKAAESTVKVNPDKVPLSPEIFKTNIVFTGTDWAPGEVVVLEMVLPPDVEIPSLEKGENAGVAFGTADEKGNFECTMGGMTKIITIFRGSMDPVTFSPKGETFNPIPAGKYEIKASGMKSGNEATTTMDFFKPPPEEKK